MVEILFNPIALTIVIGPIAGIIWSKVFNNKEKYGGDVNTLNKDITISTGDKSDVQVGQGNQINKITNTNNYSGANSANNSEGEFAFFVVIGVAVMFLYLSYQSWAMGIALTVLFFSLSFTVFGKEPLYIKLFKSFLYIISGYVLYQVFTSPIDPYYIESISNIKGKGLVGYIKYLLSGALPFTIIQNGIGQAGALVFIVISANTFRATDLLKTFPNNLKVMAIFLMFSAFPFYFLNLDSVNQYLVSFLAGGI